MVNDQASTPASRFAGIFEIHHKAVLAYAIRRCASEADAEDAAAETFVIAWRRRLDLPAEPLPFLYGVARRVIANQRRSGLRRFALHLRLREHPEPVHGLFSSETGPALAALGRLRPEDQELLRLVAWEELNHTEIAQVLGITVNAVAIRLHRARQRFEEAFRALSQTDVKDFGSNRTSPSAKGNTTASGQQEDVR